jgi:hypothetical protein
MREKYENENTELNCEDLYWIYKTQNAFQRRNYFLLLCVPCMLSKSTNKCTVLLVSIRYILTPTHVSVIYLLKHM